MRLSILAPLLLAGCSFMTPGDEVPALDWDEVRDNVTVQTEHERYSLNADGDRLQVRVSVTNSNDHTIYWWSHYYNVQKQLDGEWETTFSPAMLADTESSYTVPIEPSATYTYVISFALTTNSRYWGAVSEIPGAYRLVLPLQEHERLPEETARLWQIAPYSNAFTVRLGS